MKISYMELAKTYLGLKEISGKLHNNTIVKWLSYLKAWWKDDETAWCGVYTAHCLKTSGYPIPQKWYRAREWATYGEVSKLEYGAIAVFERKGGGHVGFIVDVDTHGNVKVLGGNQGNRVSEAWFTRDRLIAVRKPLGVHLEDIAPKTEVAKGFSTTEA